MYTYYDSIAGMQAEKFENLSGIIRYLEDFEHEGDEDSEGLIYKDSELILSYKSSREGINFKKACDE